MPSGTARTAERAEDQRVALYDVSWDDFERILEIRGDQAGVRVTYLEGVLEFLTPSVDHEGIKKTIARLLEAYAEETGITFNGFGSWTLKNRRRRRALEPVLPDLDLAALARHVNPEDQTDSVRRYRSTICRG